MRGNDFPELLRFFRKARGLSHRQAAKAFGMSLSSLQRYENGTSDPTLGKLIRIADVLGVDIDVLAGRKKISLPDRPGSTRQSDTA